jgi:arginase
VFLQMYDVDRLGIGKVMEETLDHLKSHPQVHLSFDIDAIDPFFAPHTGTAVTGGLTYREGNYICEALCESGKLTSMELVEVDPSLHKDVEDVKTIQCAITLIGSAMGKRIL